MRRIKDKIEATVTNADYATSAGSASKATNATNATKATTADKLGTSAGTTTQPVYFKDGKPNWIYDCQECSCRCEVYRYKYMARDSE